MGGVGWEDASGRGARDRGDGWEHETRRGRFRMPRGCGCGYGWLEVGEGGRTTAGCQWGRVELNWNRGDAGGQGQGRWAVCCARGRTVISAVVSDSAESDNHNE